MTEVGKTVRSFPLRSNLGMITDACTCMTRFKKRRQNAWSNKGNNLIFNETRLPNRA